MLTREVFGNVSSTSKIAFYLLAVVASASFIYGVERRRRLWRLGQTERHGTTIRKSLRGFLSDVILHRRMLARPAATQAHKLLFWGFMVLLVGTILIGIEHVLASVLGRASHDPIFHRGIYYGIYEVTLDLMGVAFLVGCAGLLLQRRRGSSSRSIGPLDSLVLSALIAIGVTGYLVEGLRILYSDAELPGLSFVGYLCALGWRVAGVTPAFAANWHTTLWWIHAILALGLIAVFPYTRLLHSIAGAIHLSYQQDELGTMRLVTLEEVEATERVGVSSIEHFQRAQLRGLDACVSCGRCEDACPAFAAGQPLSPRDLIQDVRSRLNLVGPALLTDGVDNSQGVNSLATPTAALHGETISAETLWSCTTCGACVDECPLGVDPLRIVTDMRRHLIAEGALRGAPSTSLQKMQRSGNPWGLPAEDRLNWVEGLSAPTVVENPNFDVLYWVGCAAAYDRRIQKIARAVVRLLNEASVNFAVLGSEERCTGETARRMGDEFLFQELAAANIDTLNRHGVRKIVSHCPHCVNSLSNDYPQLGGDYQVVHHSEYLAELLRKGKLTPSAGSALAGESIAYHDPCYLARARGVTEAPRSLLVASASESPNDAVHELPRHGRRTSCCGGGGGRMWFDDQVDHRSGLSRVDEIAASGVGAVAASCPFCMIMLSDGLRARESSVEVRDVAEILADKISDQP